MNSVVEFLTSVGRRGEVQGHVMWVYHGQPERMSSDWDGPFETPASVFFVERGGVEFVLEDGREVSCTVGDLFLGRRSMRRQRIAPGTRLLSVGYDLIWSNGSPVYDRGLDMHVVASDARDAMSRKLRSASLQLLRALHPERREIDFFTETHLPSPKPAQGIRHQIAFWAWFEQLLAVFTSRGVNPSEPEARSTVVREVKARLDELPLDASFREMTVGLSLSVSWRRVQQLFHEELHETPRDYFDLRRVEHARRRLRTPGVSVKEVASELGFRSLSHFSNWFKKATGWSPRRFTGGL